MQTPSPRFSRFVRSCRYGVLLVGLSMAAVACDRHSADEVPKGYGHGSSHEPSVNSHELDSQKHGKHYSDTAGYKEEAQPGVPAAAPGRQAGEAPAATPNPMGIGR